VYRGGSAVVMVCKVVVGFGVLVELAKKRVNPPSRFG